MRYRLDSSFPRRGCGEQRAARDAFDLLLSPRVPLRYALPRWSWRLVPNKTESLSLSRRGRCPHRPVAEAPVNHQASGSEKRSNSMRRPPRRPPHHPPRDGSCKLAEGHSVPEGKAKSALAPIRRPPSRAEGHCTGARLTLFSLDRARPVSLLARQKRNGGASWLDKPPAGAEISSQIMAST